MIPRRRNYYRGLLKLRVPSFFVAALFLVWAAIAWNDHTSDQPLPDDYADRALHFLDRGLRLEEVARHEPGFIKDVIYGSDYEQSLELALGSLEDLSGEDLLDEEGIRALAVMRSENGVDIGEMTGLDETTAGILGGRKISDEEAGSLAERLASSETRWWDARLAERAILADPHPDLVAALSGHEARNIRLFDLEIACTLLWWAFLFGGLFFLPHAIRVVRRGWTATSSHRPIRYGTRWNPSVVLALLIGGELLALGFLYGGYIAAADLSTGFVFDIVMDSLWRVIAPAIALFVLYRRPSHAVRSLGLDRKPDWKLILAAYAVVSWAVFAFNTAAGPWMGFDPTGGLDPMEDGPGGLFYGLLSACVLAPVAEEIFYRGVLFRGLARHFGFWLSAGVSTLAFVLAHSYDIFGQATIAMVGLTLVVVYRTTGSLATAIGLHALYNFMITLPTWLVYQADR